MPTKRTGSDQTAARKSKAFKPPSRLDKSAGGATGGKRDAAKPYARTGLSNKSNGPPRAGGSKRPLVISPESSLLEDDADSDEEDDVDDSTMQQTRRTSGVHDTTMGLDTNEEPQPVMPEPLLARLLYEGFEDKSMKVGKEAMKVVGKYVETFVREAVARAQLERSDEAGDGLGEGFLQVCASIMQKSRAERSEAHTVSATKMEDDANSSILYRWKTWKSWRHSFCSTSKGSYSIGCELYQLVLDCCVSCMHDAQHDYIATA